MAELAGLEPGLCWLRLQFHFQLTGSVGPLISEAAHRKCKGNKEAQVRSLDTQ